MLSRIDIIPSAQIDRGLWDRCVASAGNSSVYGRTFYLDGMADQWHGLVLDDYAAVFPLPWRKKWGIRYVYTPAFVQQLGLFGKAPEGIYEELKKHIRAFARYGDLMLNDNGEPEKTLALRSRCNFAVLPNGGYPAVSAAYHPDLVQTLKKNSGKGIRILQSGNIGHILSLHKELYAGRTPHVTATDLERLQHLCCLQHAKGNCEVFEAVDEQGTLLAAALLLLEGQRAYLLLNAVPPAGRSAYANYVLLDHIVQRSVEAGLAFDFEGSDLPGVKSFYRKFGGRQEVYWHWKLGPSWRS